jgi:DNA-binding NarL/FixJ family response regulator
VIHIALIDDHPIVRQGLTASLEDEPELDLVAARRPEVVLLDLELPGIGGVEAIPRLAAASPGSAILIFTAYQTDEQVLGAVRAGAKGYLLKGATTAEIVAAIRTVAAGGSALEPRIAARLLAAVRSPHAPGQLTTRERDVLRLVADGLPGKQIARALGISERTVKFHTASLLRKLGADNRAQAVALAAQRGLLTG